MIEVLSDTNTKREMDRKRKQYFQAGVSLVWYIDPMTRAAHAFTSPTDGTEFDENGVLDGGCTLPRFQLSLRELFDRADRQGPSPPD